MHLRNGTEPPKEVLLGVSPLVLSERDRASLLCDPTLRIDVEVQKKMYTVGTFPRAMLAQFSTVIAKVRTTNPTATKIALKAKINPAAVAYLFDWMLEVCASEKPQPLSITNVVRDDVDLYVAAYRLSIDEAERAAGDALLLYINTCAWDAAAFAVMVNKIPVKSRVMDHLLLVTLHLCHEDRLEAFDDIRTALKPLPLVRERMRQLDAQIEDPVKEDEDFQTCDFAESLLLDRFMFRR
ncbi:uncharacterized protein IWZ02DRAFT_485477 [Phyllosticta citriasiana]|uniref:uncharacterized protein n=1 Tax=Phyllosticta citriasiana TaxID=595635 RepID=UPI0030FD40F6